MKTKKNIIAIACIMMFGPAFVGTTMVLAQSQPQPQAAATKSEGGIILTPSNSSAMYGVNVKTPAANNNSNNSNNSVVSTTSTATSTTSVITTPTAATPSKEVKVTTTSIPAQNNGAAKTPAITSTTVVAPGGTTQINTVSKTALPSTTRNLSTIPPKEIDKTGSVTAGQENTTPVQIKKIKRKSRKLSAKSLRAIQQKQKSQYSEYLLAPLSITISAPREYLDNFNQEEIAKKINSSSKVIQVTQENIASQLNLVSNAVYSPVRVREDIYEFKNLKNNFFLSNSEIDFTRSYVAIAQVYDEDIKLNLFDFNNPPNGNLEFDPQPYFAKTKNPGCSSVALYLWTKNLNNLIFPINNYEKSNCSKTVMVSDNGVINAEDDVIVNVTNFEQNNHQIFKVDVLKDGWAIKQPGLLFGQPAQLVFIDDDLNISVAPQSNSSQYHYAKASDINYNTFKTSSPFIFTAKDLNKQKNYRTFVMTKPSTEIRYYPTTIYLEDLQAQFKNSTTQIK